MIFNLKSWQRRPNSSSKTT